MRARNTKHTDSSIKCTATKQTSANLKTVGRAKPVATVARQFSNTPSSLHNTRPKKKKLYSIRREAKANRRNERKSLRRYYFMENKQKSRKKKFTGKKEEKFYFVD